MHLVFRFSSNLNIQPVIEQLNKQGIEHEVINANEQQELWLADDGWSTSVKQFCMQYKMQKQQSLSLENLKSVPVIGFLLVITLLSALFTQLGDQFAQHFFIAHVVFDPRGWYLYEGAALLWHSISPIFLHFSIEHVVFNSLMFWFLGSLLERLLGHVQVFILIVFIALLSNYAQLFMSGPLFGGLSGVVYGLLMFAFAYQFFLSPLFLPNGLFYVAMVWLLLGLTPFFSWIGLGQMANTAHVSGLLAGLFYFTVYALLGLRGSHEH